MVMKMEKQSIKKITDEITETLLKKNQDYGGASFDLGLNGNMVHLWDKIKRYKHIVENKGQEPNYEKLRDTLLDIIGYAIIGIQILDDDNIKDKIYGKN